MKTWNEGWREALRLMKTHASPKVVLHHLNMMAEKFPEFVEFCAHCNVGVGPCVSSSGRPAETHSMRLTRAGV